MALLAHDYYQSPDLSDHDTSTATAVFNTAAEEATCPACGHVFSTTRGACPDCGLCFA